MAGSAECVGGAVTCGNVMLGLLASHGWDGSNGPRCGLFADRASGLPTSCPESCQSNCNCLPTVQSTLSGAHTEWRKPSPLDCQPEQAWPLLLAVRRSDPTPEASVGCRYFSALRSGEAQHPRTNDSNLPSTGWGRLRPIGPHPTRLQPWTRPTRGPRGQRLQSPDRHRRGNSGVRSGEVCGTVDDVRVRVNRGARDGDTEGGGWPSGSAPGTWRTCFDPGKTPVPRPNRRTVPNRRGLAGTITRVAPEWSGAGGRRSVRAGRSGITARRILTHRAGRT